MLAEWVTVKMNILEVWMLWCMEDSKTTYRPVVVSYVYALLYANVCAVVYQFEPINCKYAAVSPTHFCDAATTFNALASKTFLPWTKLRLFASYE